MKWTKISIILMAVNLAACATDADNEKVDNPQVEVVQQHDTVYVSNTDTVYIKEDEKADPVQKNWTAAIVKKDHKVTGSAVVQDVRLATHQDYERVVVEFSDQMPSYEVEYIDEPYHQCGSGNQMWLKGDGLLEIRLTTAAAHTEQGEPTVKRTYKSLENIQELKVACDFEGHVNILAGVGSPNQFAVFELQNPPRLVIDIKKGQ